MADSIALLNFLSRWILFAAVAYKTYRTQDKGWALISAAAFINALDVEAYILTPLGITIPKPVYTVSSKIPNFYVSILALWGSFHLKYKKTSFRHVLCLSAILVISYVWIFLLAVDAFHGNFALNSSFPSLLLGGSIVYLSVVLWNYVIPRRLWDRLFPIGLFIVGVLNLTYPVTRNIEWYSHVAFFTAALGRLLAALGAFTFVFYPISEPSGPQRIELKSGAYFAKDVKEVTRTIPDFFQNDLVAVTRTSPHEARRRFTPASMVFWVTKAREGQVEEAPTVVAISPTKLGILQDLVVREVEQGFRVVYIDAFEYLSVEVGFQNAMKFLLSVRDFVLSHGGLLILIASPEAFKEQEFKIIQREFRDINELLGTEEKKKA
ncbi:hypothetical protein A3L09_08890 [Thermococcus profundus]|uniref:DUF835 domain-containing protein n=1 Tax=Thermococcus profundus TaxID=49899 RepID=A0A2Z2MHE7_THEPR|nr:DUF835 domain-containing protein [Thermococcus profundus]ASJ03364.1 hypothetical protein A3L09_08890 [Thermococcus profundus]